MRARLRAKRERTRWLGWVTRSEKAEAVASRRHGGPPATGGPVTEQREKERERERRTRGGGGGHNTVLLLWLAPGFLLATVAEVGACQHKCPYKHRTQGEGFLFRINNPA